jgi:hypothetical protein
VPLPYKRSKVLFFLPFQLDLRDHMSHISRMTLRAGTLARGGG